MVMLYGDLHGIVDSRRCMQGTFMMTLLWSTVPFELELCMCVSEHTVFFSGACYEYTVHDGWGPAL